MVFDRIENAELYSELNERVKIGLEYLAETDFSKMESGKYVIDGEFVFAILSEYDSKPEAECKLEAHLNYIDIQYIVEGHEKMGYVAKTNQIPTIAYSSEKDVMFFNEDVKFLSFEKGNFAIYYPTDLHQPCVMDGEVSKIRKVVVKVAV